MSDYILTYVYGTQTYTLHCNDHLIEKDIPMGPRLDFLVNDWLGGPWRGDMINSNNVVPQYRLVRDDG